MRVLGSARGISTTLAALFLPTLLACQSPTVDEEGVIAEPVVSREPAAESGAVQAWQCGDLRVETRFDTDMPDQIELELPGGVRMLSAVVSASGARFSDAPDAEQVSTVFWNKGDASLLILDGESLSCAAVDLRSPWALAREQGARLRATGNEPGWVMTVESGADGERMRLERMGLADAIWHARVSGEGQAYEAPEGAVRIEVSDELCADSMSGTRFPVSVVIKLGDEQLAGCGRHYAVEP